MHDATMATHQWRPAGVIHTVDDAGSEVIVMADALCSDGQETGQVRYRLLDQTPVDGDTPRVRSCCLTKECYSWARCRFGFFSSIFMVEGGGHVVEGCGGGQRTHLITKHDWCGQDAPVQGICPGAFDSKGEASASAVRAATRYIDSQST
jgi:hypothetical protein